MKTINSPKGQEDSPEVQGKKPSIGRIQKKTHDDVEGTEAMNS